MPAALMDGKFEKTFFKIPFSIEVKLEESRVKEKRKSYRRKLLLLLARLRGRIPLGRGTGSFFEMIEKKTTCYFILEAKRMRNNTTFKPQEGKVCTSIFSLALRDRIQLFIGCSIVHGQRLD